MHLHVTATATAHQSAQHAAAAAAASAAHHPFLHAIILAAATCSTSGSGIVGTGRSVLTVHCIRPMILSCRLYQGMNALKLLTFLMDCT